MPNINTIDHCFFFKASIFIKFFSKITVVKYVANEAVSVAFMLLGRNILFLDCHFIKHAHVMV